MKSRRIVNWILVLLTLATVVVVGFSRCTPEEGTQTVRSEPTSGDSSILANLDAWEVRRVVDYAYNRVCWVATASYDAGVDMECVPLE
jgi:hypothetical protein